jgi:putative flippase GtrA
VSRVCEIFEKYRKGIIQFIKFNFVGIINTVITFIIFTLLNKLFGVDKFIAEPVGYVCGLINSFILNKIWTFGKKHSFHLLETVKFIIVNAFSLGGTLFILYAAEDLLHIDVIWGKLIAYFYSIPFNYLGFKYWVFKA